MECCRWTFTYTPITRRTLLVAAIAFALAVGLGRSEAAQPAIYTGLLSSTAVGGFDPVSFTMAPVAGSRSITTTWMGATWRFASEATKRVLSPPRGVRASLWRLLRLGGLARLHRQGRSASLEGRQWPPLSQLRCQRAKDLGGKTSPGHITKADGNWPKVLAR